MTPDNPFGPFDPPDPEPDWDQILQDYALKTAEIVRLRARVAELEAENAALRETLMHIHDYTKDASPRDWPIISAIRDAVLKHGK